MGLRAYAVSMTVIVLVWAAVAYWGLRELSAVLKATP